MQTTVYIVPRNRHFSTDPQQYIYDSFECYDVELYREDADQWGVRKLAKIEWAEWARVDNQLTFADLSKAQAHAAESNSPVITVTLSDMEAAIERLVAVDE
jgi:hypothetical protein